MREIGEGRKFSINRIKTKYSLLLFQVFLQVSGMKHYYCEQCGKKTSVSHSTKRHRICARCIRIGRIP